MKTEVCMECGKHAKWLRCTQFAGEHPYCDKHAKEQKDFQREDSCTYWITVAAENKRKREEAKAKKAEPKIKVSELKFLGHPLFQAPATTEQSHYFTALPDDHVVRVDFDGDWCATFRGVGFRLEVWAQSPEEALAFLERQMWRALEQLQKLREGKP